MCGASSVGGRRGATLSTAARSAHYVIGRGGLRKSSDETSVTESNAASRSLKLARGQAAVDDLFALRLSLFVFRCSPRCASPLVAPPGTPLIHPFLAPKLIRDGFGGEPDGGVEPDEEPRLAEPLLLAAAAAPPTAAPAPPAAAVGSLPLKSFIWSWNFARICRYSLPATSPGKAMEGHGRLWKDLTVHSLPLASSAVSDLMALGPSWARS